MMICNWSTSSCASPKSDVCHTFSSSRNTGLLLAGSISKMSRVVVTAVAASHVTTYGLPGPICSSLAVDDAAAWRAPLQHKVRYVGHHGVHRLDDQRLDPGHRRNVVAIGADAHVVERGQRPG